MGNSVAAQYDPMRLEFVRGGIWALREDWKRQNNKVSSFDKMVGLDTDTIIRFVKYNKRPRPRTVVKMCQYLGIAEESVITNYKKIYRQRQRYIVNGFEQINVENYGNDAKKTDEENKFSLTQDEIEQVEKILNKIRNNNVKEM